MSDHGDGYPGHQPGLFDDGTERALLDELLLEARLYKSSKDYKELLDFVVRLRNFAPFNAMLLQIQKPGLSHALLTKEWLAFGRRPKEGARPLLILWPFGPVALVYDILDTEGEPLPEDARTFVAKGEISEARIHEFEPVLARKNIDCLWVDAGDHSAGQIRVVKRATSDKDSNRYRIHVNRNHEPAVQFNTLTHELAHLFLGHLGADKKLRITARPVASHEQRELEAESVAYIVCHRHGVAPKSQTYLSSFVNANTTTELLDVYQILRSAGQVEALLGLSAHSRATH